MSSRRDMRRARQEAHHRAQLDRAPNARLRLSAACQFLIAEAARAGDAEAANATEYVLAYVDYLRTRPPAQEGTEK